MAMVLPPPPINDAPGSFTWLEWYRQLRNYVSQSGSVPWNVIDFSGSNITSITTRLHNNLQNIQGGSVGEYYHLTQAQRNSITDTAHNSRTSIQGGTTNQYYHMTSAQWTALFTSRSAPAAASNASGTTPSKAEFDALVTEVNALRTILIDAGLCY